MNRRTLITIHLYLSSFLAANVLLVAISGGLYLFGNKGSTSETTVGTLLKSEHILPAKASKADVERLLAGVDISDHDFEYVKQSDTTAVTRPTSREHYLIDAGGDAIVINRVKPDLVKKMVELHKGHGPGWFKHYSKVFAAGLIFVIVSGLWLGLTSPILRSKTLVSVIAGITLFGLLVAI
ncbi:conserved hypothetical protein [Luminiphilus syltensis NOR5-1B]|uniref:PepSY-associated TM helix n=1 Tax=Luminiphilus syltensis NOR5-1B TaxID=565045 RepID=B8KX55_9GAMM|nr:hypothetical protein [Luminiphilus syltensis]EED35352.1 conserved hypothetical protein [Luminiphilus syltensis NOR5-1B]